MTIPPGDDPNTSPETERVGNRSDRRTLAVAIGILAFVIVGFLKPWGSDRQPDATTTAVASFAPRSSASEVPPSPSQRTTSGLCDDGRVELSPGGDAPATVVLPVVPAAGGRQVAFVVSTGDPATPGGHDLVVVADASGTRTVATASSTAGLGRTGWARVRGWSVDGSVVLVGAGRSSPGSAQDNCSDLFLVRTDGPEVTRLTQNGPGQSAVNGALLPDGNSIVYVQTNPVSGGPALAVLRVVGADGLIRKGLPVCDATRNDYLLPTEGAVVPSPDGTLLAVMCPNGVMTINPETNEAALTFSAAPLSLVGIGWASDSRHVVALADRNAKTADRLTVYRADWRGDTVTKHSTPVADWQTSYGIAGISPDGSQILAQACASGGGIPGGCQEQRIYAIDVATGASRVVDDSTAHVLVLHARWLPDGKHVAIEDLGGGSVIRQADGLGDSIPTDLPWDAAWWSSAR